MTDDHPSFTPKQRAVRRVLTELRDKDGLDIDKAIKVAQNPKSPMHSYFTWDVEKAAWKRWRDEARMMLNDVHYVEKRTKVVVKISNWGAVRIKNGKTVRKPLDEIMDDVDQRKAFFQDELDRIEAMLERGRKIAKIMKFSNDLDKALNIVRVMRKKVT